MLNYKEDYFKTIFTELSVEDDEDEGEEEDAFECVD